MAGILVLGGIRSGKSDLAERLAGDSCAGYDGGVIYVATAQPGDGEMAERIRCHQQRRPSYWGLIEEPLRLGRILATTADKPRCLLIDCMSLWLSNMLHAGGEHLARERTALLNELERYPGEVVIVSNEVGLGVIGMDELTRRFCDELGWLNQALAARCTQVWLSVAGLPQCLKPVIN